MKAVFFGTPDFAASSLQALLSPAGKALGLEVAAVYCQPDRPAGRGHALRIGPVKALALAAGLPVLQPLNFKDPASLDALGALGADIFVVAAYGLILPKALLDLPPLGAINVHGSLLPELRGAAPIQRAVMRGDIRTGITIMRVEPRLDSGPILLQRALAIGMDETAGQVYEQMAALGGELLLEAVGRFKAGAVHEQAQDESRATYAAKLTKTDGLLDFSQTARQLHNQARGVTPWPGAQVCLARQDENGRELVPLQVLVEKGTVLREEGPSLDDNGLPYEPGQALPVRGETLPLACADGLYGIERLRPAGGKSMTGAAFANGYLKNCRAVAEPSRP
ncbi:MAG: methionyl-tRNA formyltransferase [Deltaproteobacteria bacterium]|jgi:methionyl-tRNA formyltransferase|nr:methionyl-tRNA formyltransferase [Deltaproteobacteria bacterium]